MSPTPSDGPAAAGLFSGLTKPSGGAAQPPLSRAVLAGGAVAVSGPSGFCIDRDSQQRNFAIIVTCRALTNGTTGVLVDPAIITVSVTPADSSRQLPSASDFARNARVLGGQNAADFVTVHLDGKTNHVLKGADSRHWRAVFELNDRFVGLGLYAPKGSPLAGMAGADLLRETRDRIRHASVRGGHDTAPQPKNTKKKEGLLAGLFKR
ncbi:MAG: dihydroxy-acid dehydratase [Pelagimonas sp.]|nr:dihydroxy-acid dehydratase [Pelagimonas sp.]